MSDRLTLAEIEAQFVSEWVLIEDPQTNNALEVQSGKVLYHSKDRKVREHTIVIVKNLPVLECANCAQYLITDPDFSRVEQILTSVNGAAELEIIRYVA